jgi:hypothetical protein
MALAPINPTQITPPRVEFIDPRSGAISREWYRFFLSLRNATETNQSEIELAPDTASLIATYDAMLETLTQTTESNPDAGSFAVTLEKQLYDFENTVLTEPRNEYVETASAVASLQVLTWLGL